MAKQTKVNKQLAQVSDLIDLKMQSTQKFVPFENDDLVSILQRCGVIYSDLLAQELNNVDAVSSGVLADSIQPLDVEINGNIYRIEIEAKTYAQFIDRGVNGWANSRGSKYSFKTKGVAPQSPMVKSLEAYIKREGLSARNVKVAISERERKGQKMLPATTKAAMQMAFMVKRQGIKHTHFWERATQRAIPIIQDEIGKQYKISIINYLVQ